MVIDRLMIGGAENVCVDLIQRFRDDFNYELITITSGKEYLNSLKGITIYNLNRKFKLNLFDAYRLHLKLSQFLVIHIHLRHTYRYVAWVKKLFRGKYKIILHDHEGKVYIDENPPFPEWRILKPDYFIGVCDKLTNWGRTLWKLNQNQSLTLLNLISAQTFTDKHNQIKPSYYICVGNIKSNKNQIFCAELATISNKNITFFGNNQDSNYFKRLTGLSSNSTILENIQLNSAIIKKFKLGLFSSIYESGPLVVMEYLMAGIPFLAYKVGGISDAIAEYFPEYFIENFNHEEWISRIGEIENNPIPKEIYEERMNRLLEEKFSAEKYKAKLMEIYQSLI